MQRRSDQQIFIFIISLKQMNNRLYIGGLPYSSSEDDLKNHFAQAGNVLGAQIIVDRMTGRSRGFGFVEMSTEEEANKAITMFHGKDFGGRSLTVNIARPKAER